MPVNPYSFKDQYKSEWQFLQQQIAGRYTSGTRFDPRPAPRTFDAPVFKPPSYAPSPPVQSYAGRVPSPAVGPSYGPTDYRPPVVRARRGRQALKFRLISPNWQSKPFAFVDRFFLAIPNFFYWAVMLSAIGAGGAVGLQYSVWGGLLGAVAGFYASWLAFVVLYVAIKIVLSVVLITATIAAIGIGLLIVAQLVGMARVHGWL